MNTQRNWTIYDTEMPNVIFSSNLHHINPLQTKDT